MRMERRESDSKQRTTTRDCAGMSDRTVVLSTYEIESDIMVRLERTCPGLSVRYTPTPRDMEPHIASANVVLSLNFSDALLQDASQLRWFQSVGAGVNHLPIKGFLEKGVLLTNARGNHAIPVSEHAFALLLALTRRIYRCYGDDNIVDRWERVQGDELYGKTMGVLGLGAIGREIARKAQSFGMTVRGLDEVPTFIPYLHEVYLSDQVKEFFSGLDVLVVAAALTTSTDGIVNRQNISLMKPNSYVVNISRGPLIVEEDLASALKDEYLAGAGLDVFDEEPLPGDNVLRTLPNVVLTPHIGGFNPRYARRVWELFAENFRRWVAGEPLINVINLAEVHCHDEGRA